MVEFMNGFNGSDLILVISFFLTSAFLLPRFLKEPSLFEAGYKYAQVELRSGRKSPYDLEAETLRFEARTDFDRGIDAAIDDMVRFGHAKDNRLY